jgi:hypothetical protein
LAREKEEEMALKKEEEMAMKKELPAEEKPQVVEAVTLHEKNKSSDPVISSNPVP